MALYRSYQSYKKFTVLPLAISLVGLPLLPLFWIYCKLLWNSVFLPPEFQAPLLTRMPCGFTTLTVFGTVRLYSPEKSHH